MSRVMLNGGVTLSIALAIFVHQGCPLCTLLFQIVIPPFLVMSSKLATNVSTYSMWTIDVDCSASLMDDFFVFLQVSLKNLENDAHVRLICNIV